MMPPAPDTYCVETPWVLLHLVAGDSLNNTIEGKYNTVSLQNDTFLFAFFDIYSYNVLYFIR